MRFEAVVLLFGLVLPAVAQDAQPSPPLHAPAYDEREISFPSEAGQIPGTLTLPTRRSAGLPLVLMVAGSGPQDRDETIGPNKPFRDLARGLAQAGIASLRYDKRTFLVRSRTLAAPGPGAVTLDWEVTNDAVAALRFAAKQPEINPAALYALGHSLGGTMAPYIATRYGSLRGVILLAAGARPIVDILHDQALGLKQQGATDEQVAAVLANQKTLFEKVNNPATSANEMIGGAPIGYWRDWQARNPLEEWKKLRLPVLVLQGGRDMQVSQADYDLLRQTLSGSINQFYLIPDVNHLFMPVEAGIGVRGYQTPGQVDPRVIAYIASFVNKTSP